MNRPLFRRLLFVGIAAWLGAGVIGCGSKVSGKYVDSSGMLTIQFDSGKATVTSGGASETDDFTVSGNTVTISRPQGSGQFTIMPDGTLQGNGLTLSKAAN